jgi:hypothetical protein
MPCTVSSICNWFGAFLDTSQTTIHRYDSSQAAPCAHMFCKNCLLSEFQEQVSRSNKHKHRNRNGSTCKMPFVDGGSCPVCHEWVKTECIIQIERSDDRLVSRYLNPNLVRSVNGRQPESEKEDVLNRDVVAREALESAINGARSSNWKQFWRS